MNSLELCALAVSLGAVDTLVQHSALMPHADIPGQVRIKTEISDDLMRLSADIEEPEDIMAVPDQALGKV